METEILLAEHYALRLQRLIRIFQDHSSTLNGKGRWLMLRSIHATLADCINANPDSVLAYLESVPASIRQEMGKYARRPSS